MMRGGQFGHLDPLAVALCGSERHSSHCISGEAERRRQVETLAVTAAERGEGKDAEKQRDTVISELMDAGHSATICRGRSGATE